jgi:hypothetical protein
MVIGNSEKQNIAIQHRYFKTHGGHIRARNPVSFEKWFLVCLRKCEKRGAEFTFLCPGLVRTQWPGKTAILRTVANFREEYENEYLSNF